MESRTFILKHVLPVSRVERYWRGLEDGKIYGTRCKSCGASFYPPQADCSFCYSSDIEWVEVGGEGVVECFTRIQRPPQGFEFVGSGYTITVARFGEFKVMGWFKGEGLPKVGMRVKAETGRDESGVWKVYFVPT